MTNKLQYVKHCEINFIKWDNLINSNKNGRVFNYSWYLNQFCQWDAIILGDYEAAIPLPISSKWGIKALLQPNFIQQCNWIGELPSTNELDKIKTIIKSKFSIVHFNTNLALTSNIRKRDNFILDILDWNILEANFNKSLRKNIKKASKRNTINYQANINQTIKLYRLAYGDMAKHLKAYDFNLLAKLTYKYPESFINIHVMQDEETTASLLFAIGKNRIHYILGAPTKKGRTLNSLSYGLSEVLTKYANKNLILDFEGSSIKSVKDFYLSYGAKNEPFIEATYYSPLIKPLILIYNKFFRSI